MGRAADKVSSDEVVAGPEAAAARAPPPTATFISTFKIN